MKQPQNKLKQSEETLINKVIPHTFKIKNEVVTYKYKNKNVKFKEVEITKELLKSMKKGDRFILPSWDNTLDYYDYSDIDTFQGKVKNKNSVFFGQYHYTNDDKEYEGWIDPEDHMKRMYLVIKE